MYTGLHCPLRQVLIEQKFIFIIFEGCRVDKLTCRLNMCNILCTINNIWPLSQPAPPGFQSINQTCYMYFRYEFGYLERMTCARTKPFDNVHSLKLYDSKIKRISKTKFLGVVIDENLNWNSHINYLENKLKLSIVMIKRIKKFITTTEYLKIYYELFSYKL